LFGLGKTVGDAELIALNDDHRTRYEEAIPFRVLRQLIGQAARYAMRYPLPAAQLLRLRFEFLATSVTFHELCHCAGGRL
jgi:hypothetical protein